MTCLAQSAVCAALAFLCAACGAGTRSVEPSPGLRLAEPRDFRVAVDPLSMRMRELATELQARGLQPTRVQLRDFVAPGARRTRRLLVPPGSCMTLVTLATRAVHDIDAALYTPEGDLLTADSQPDAHPTIQVCGGDTPRVLYYALHVYEGAGSVLMASFKSDRAALERAASLLRSRPSLADLSGPGGAGPQRAATFADGIRRRGFEASEAAVTLTLASGQRMRVPFSVDSGRCYTTASFLLSGDPGLELRVLDDEGSEVARDDGGQDAAMTQFCAERPGQYAAELVGDADHATVTFGVYGAAADEVGGPSGLWLGERPLARASETPLEEAVAAADEQARQDGYQPKGAVEPGTIARGQATSLRLQLSADRCTRLQVLGGPGIRELELRLASADNDTLAEARGDAAHAFLHFCSAGKAATHAVLEVHAQGGYGAYAVRRFEAPLTHFPAGANEAVSASFRQVARLARDAGYEPHRSFTGGPLRLDENLAAQRPALQWGLVPGLCVRAYLLSDDRRLSARLVSHGKTLDVTSPGKEPAHACRTAGAALDHVRLDVERKPARDAWLMLYEKRAPEAQPATRPTAP